MSIKKEIKVFIASSGEMKDQRDQLVLLFDKISSFFKRELLVIPVMWESMDASMTPNGNQTDTYDPCLIDSDICIVLFRNFLGEYTLGELNLAYERLINGGNPRKVFVYFQRSNTISEKLITFRDSFKNCYNGCFYITYDNTDSLLNHFTLQLLSFMSAEKIIYISKDNKISDYQDNDDDENIRRVSLAMEFIKASNTVSSMKIQKAREFFETGNILEAASMFDLHKMATEAEDNAELLELQRKKISTLIEEYIVAGNAYLLIGTNFTRQAFDAFCGAINLSRKYNDDENHFLTLERCMFQLCALTKDKDIIRKEQWLSYWEEMVVLSEKLAYMNPKKYFMYFWTASSNLSSEYISIQEYSKAEQFIKKRIQSFKKIPKTFCIDTLDLCWEYINLIELYHGRSSHKKVNHVVKNILNCLCICDIQDKDDMANLFILAGKRLLTHGHNFFDEDTDTAAIYYQNAILCFRSVLNVRSWDDEIILWLLLCEIDLGNCIKKHKPQKAEKLFLSALSHIRDSLSKLESGHRFTDMLIHYAHCARSYCELLLKNGQFLKSIPIANIIVDTYEKLTHFDKDSYEELYAESLQILAQIYKQLKMNDECDDIMKIALPLLIKYDKIPRYTQR